MRWVSLGTSHFFESQSKQRASAGSRMQRYKANIVLGVMKDDVRATRRAIIDLYDSEWLRRQTPQPFMLLPMVQAAMLALRLKHFELAEELCLNVHHMREEFGVSDAVSTGLMGALRAALSTA